MTAAPPASDDAFGLDVLAFGPHPDDVELCCGGTLARLGALGYRTGVVDLTAGELASNGTPGTRAAEAAAAAAVLGLSVRENLGLPDGFLDASAGYADAPAQRGANTQVARIVEVLRRLRPELVLAPYPAARHPDHEAASELVTRAVFFAGLARFATEPQRPRFTPRQVLYYQMRFAFTPSVIVDTSAAAAAKGAAIACYASQVARAPAARETLANAPLALSALAARDAYYGSMIGTASAEPFHLHSAVALADPVAHFRANAFAPPLTFPAQR
jgi:bacillithiol biosynthesis deacetylase BshB1